MMQTQDILDHLIAFDTVSSRPNAALMHWVRDLLGRHGIDAVLIPDASGAKANLYATIGPQDRPGVLLVGAYRCGAGRRPGLDHATLRR